MIFRDIVSENNANLKCKVSILNEQFKIEGTVKSLFKSPVFTDYLDSQITNFVITMDDDFNLILHLTIDF